MSTIALSLRISHPKIESKTISEAVNLLPGASWSAGDLRMTPKGRLLKGQRTSSFWTAKLAINKEKSIEENLQDTLNSLEKSSSFFKQIISTGGKVELFMGWFVNGNDGFILVTELLRRFVLLGISISIDGYFE